MKTLPALLILLLLGASCEQAPKDRVGILHVPDDPTKVLLVNGRRLTGDVPVSLRNGRMFIGDQFVDTAPTLPTRKYVGYELDMLKISMAWQGPTLIVFAGAEPRGFPGRHINGRERALHGIAEIAALEDFAAKSADPIPERASDDVLPEAARREIAASVRAH